MDLIIVFLAALGYTPGSTDTWDILDLADEDPNNAANILDVYRNSSFPKAGGATPTTSGRTPGLARIASPMTVMSRPNADRQLQPPTRWSLERPTRRSPLPATREYADLGELLQGRGNPQAISASLTLPLCSRRRERIQRILLPLGIRRHRTGKPRSDDRAKQRATFELIHLRLGHPPSMP